MPVLHDAKNGSYMINLGQDWTGNIGMHDGRGGRVMFIR